MRAPQLLVWILFWKLYKLRANVHNGRESNLHLIICASPHLRGNVWWWWWYGYGVVVVGGRRRRRGPVGSDGGGAGGGFVVLERPVLVHLPVGLGPRRRAAAVEDHGLLHPDGAAVGRRRRGGVDDPGRARGLPVPRRRRPAGPPAPRLPLLPRAEVEPRLPLPGSAAAGQHLVDPCMHHHGAPYPGRAVSAMHRFGHISIGGLCACA